MIDWHCHILPGLDDGPATTDEAVEMAQALVHAGYSTVHCTPHLIRGCYEADDRQIVAALSELQAELDRRETVLRLVAGREYCLDEFLPDYLDAPLPLGRTNFLLVEIPSNALPDFVKDVCYRIKCSGFVPMIAHPERCRLLEPPQQAISRKGIWGSIFNPKIKAQNSTHEERSLLGYLKDLGCAFQGNLGSFAGRYGEDARKRAFRLQGEGVYTHFGTDLHSAARIGQTMAGAYKAGLTARIGGIATA